MGAMPNPLHSPPKPEHGCSAMFGLKMYKHGFGVVPWAAIVYGKNAFKHLISIEISMWVSPAVIPTKNPAGHNTTLLLFYKSIAALSVQRAAVCFPILGAWAAPSLLTAKVFNPAAFMKRRKKYKHPYLHCNPGKLAREKSVDQVYRHAQCTVFVNIAQAKHCAVLCTQ